MRSQSSCLSWLEPFGSAGRHNGWAIDRQGTKKVLSALTDEKGREVHSEKMVEIIFKDGVPVYTSDQFGIGRVR